jgi:hypothetical protein
VLDASEDTGQLAATPEDLVGKVLEGKIRRLVAFGVFVGDRQQYRLLDRRDLISAEFTDVIDCAIAHAEAWSDETIDAQDCAVLSFKIVGSQIPMKFSAPRPRTAARVFTD